MTKFLRIIYGKKFYKQTAFISFLAFASACTQFLVTYYLGRIIDAVVEGYGETMVYFYVITVFLILYICCSALLTCLGSQLNAKLISQLQNMVGEKLCYVEYQDIEMVTDSELFTIATKDIEGVKWWVETMLKIGFLPAHLGLVVIVLMQYNWKFSIFTLGLIPLAALPEMLLAKKTPVFYQQEREAYATSLSLFTETIDRFMVMKAFLLEELFKEKNRDKLGKYKTEKMRRLRREQLVDVYGRCYGRIINPILLILGAWFILNGEMTLGTLTSIILMTGFVGEGLKILCEIPIRFQTGKFSVSRIQSLLCMPNEQDLENNRKIGDVSEKIVFDVRSLQFKYDDKPVLRGISFQVYEGEKIAIIGASGCGKTTLFKLLSRLYMPQVNQIFFRGEDITSLSLAYLREKIAVTTQESFLFHASIRENIRMACPQSTDEMVDNAAKNAALNLQEEIETPINTTVQSISNGQMQRINLARAFLKDTDVFLLDEPTSALDADTANQIYDYIFNVLRDRTVLVILHDLKEVHQFDRVLRLENGRVKSYDKIH